MIEKCNEITGVWREEVCVWGGGGHVCLQHTYQVGIFWTCQEAFKALAGGGESRGGGGVTGLSAADSLET